MATARCDVRRPCPRCGFENGPAEGRCLRCGQALPAPAGCSGQCTRCLLDALARPSRPIAEGGRTKGGD